MLIFGFRIKSISWLCTNFPLWIFCIIKFIGGDIVWTFRSLFTEAINKSHLFINKLFGLGLSSGCSKRKFRSRWFCTAFNLTKSTINVRIRKFNKILISVDFFLLFILSLIFLCIHDYLLLLFLLNKTSFIYIKFIKCINININKKFY